MGCFSWLKAEYDEEQINIKHGDQFKCLIPKEFDKNNIGYIIESYYDAYGHLEDRNDSSNKYDLYEFLAIWNNEYILPEKISIYDWDTHKETFYPEGTKVRDILKGIDYDNPLKAADENTEHNRQIGISIGCYNRQVDLLKYPLKLVSTSCNKTYEQCAGKSYDDPEQGMHAMSPDELFRGDLFLNNSRYDGVLWEDVYMSWAKIEEMREGKHKGKLAFPVKE